MLRQAIYAVALIQAMVGAGAELPARVYTTQDGLVHDEVLRIRRDSRGYLWLGTADGLSIFDGYGFSNYTTADGLPNNAVTDILETRSGEYWIATRGGLCRFEPNASPGHRFVTVRAAQNALAVIVNVLAERRDGSIWFGTEGGLWRLHLTGKTYSAVRVPLPSPAPDSQRVFAITEDHDGALWIAASDGIYVLRGDAASRFGKHDGLPDDYTHDLLADNRGRLWAATADGVYQITFPCPGHSFVERAYTNRGLPRETAISLLQSADGKLWVAGRGLFEFDPDARAEQPAFRRVLAPFGGNLLAKALAEDADHNLWVGGAGAVKVTRHGFTTFSFADGLRALRMHALLEDRDGRVCAITSWNGLTIHRFDGSRFTAVSSYLPPGFHYSWGESQISFQDHAGEWWVPTENGLLRFARPKRIEDLASATPAVYSTALGLPSDVVLRLFEDSRGDVWIGVYKGLARWIRRSGKIQAYSGVDGIPFVTAHPPELPTPNAIAEDRSGQIWIGFHPSGLARVRGGRFEFFTSVNGLPNGQINGVYCDSRGHVWVASSQGGLARIDNPGAAKPVFRVYTTAQGLSSNQVYHTVDDAQHRIYATVGSGVDRLDPETGSVRHFTTADGVPALPKYALRDRTGALWFASAYGLSRYVPEPDDTAPPAAPLVRALRVAGKPIQIPALGESAIAGLRLAPAQNNLQIEFASVHFASGEILRYQYMLESADSDWSPPAEQRIVNYASLAPGAYRFIVRAVNGEGRISAGVASVGFVILPPLWRTPRFISLAVVLTAALLYFAYRYRLTQALRIERIRTRLASDLHDDIGAGLAEIAILSEVAKGARNGDPTDAPLRIGDRARQLRDAMSDIVWSVDPRHGSLAGLIARLRQTVYDMADASSVTVEFSAPAERDVSRVALPPDRARHVLLIAKEALTNIAKHARARTILVRIAVERGALTLEIIDDGIGFDPDFPSAGMGLRNLRRRAAESLGRLRIESARDHGTRVLLTLPLTRSLPHRPRMTM